MPIAPAALAAFSQFVLWRLEERPGQVKLAKVPFDPTTGHRCDAQDPNQWLPYAGAVALSQAHPGSGVGFAFTAGDPFWFLDVDGCVDAAGQWTPIGADVLSRFPGAAFELSQSHMGFHLFGTGTIPADHRKRNELYGVEFYTDKRFVALTGFRAQGDAALDCTSAVGDFLATYLPASGPEVVNFEWTSEPRADWSGPTDDNALVAKAREAMGAAGAFGGVTFGDIWTANADKLATKYPPNANSMDTYGASEADAALMSHLAFWTGCDCERMERIARMSALVRQKWDDRDDYYLRRTIRGACARCENVYSDAPRAETRKPDATIAPTMSAGDLITVRTGYQLMTVEQQFDYFKGCVYVRSHHRVLTPEGDMLRPDQFKTSYGGYEFIISPDNARPSKNAFEVFTESRAANFPAVHDVCFRPDIPVDILEEEGRLLANMYKPRPVERVKGDVTPFLTHIGKLFLDALDREIILSYMAAVVQYPGIKFQWAPMVQGVEGNGKTYLIRCLEKAVGRTYSHLANASDIASKFNAWIQCKLFIGLDEVYVSDHQEVIDALKPLITNARIEIQGKGVNQVTGDNRANWFLTSNRLNAIPKTRNDRRYAVFYTAQQDEKDFRRDGMEGRYFPSLYDWSRNGGYAKVSEFLATYPIADEFNPAGACHRAPHTSSTEAAIDASMGAIEQEVLEATLSGRPGFCGGWISSIALDGLLRERRYEKTLPRNKRKDVLASLGYAPHPALPAGRVSAVIPQESGRPTLYVENGAPERGLTRSEVAAAYGASQGYGGIPEPIEARAVACG